MLSKILIVSIAVLIAIIIALFFITCAKPIPVASERYVNKAPVEEFEVPTEKLTLPVDSRQEVKEFVRKENILPFTFFDQHHFFFLAKDEENVYVTLDAQEDLEQSHPEEAKIRKPYRGISAFDIKTKKLKWNIPFDDPNTCTFKADPKLTRISEPFLLGNKLIVFKRNYTTDLANCYNIIDKETGKVLHWDGMQGGRYKVEYLKYLVKYEYKKSISLLNPDKGEKLWTYTLGQDFLGDGTARIQLLNDGVCYYFYQKAAQFGFDFIEIASGKIIKHLEFEKKDFNQTSLKPLSLQGDIVFFEVNYCATTGFEVRPANCEYCYIMFDTRNGQILKRTNYKK
ncbi:MAG: hypothetical protein IPG29_10930 [Sphingobacteriales bacterium]|nr:hypothetical protein [Sphingobacteriales bacterium]